MTDKAKALVERLRKDAKYWEEMDPYQAGNYSRSADRIDQLTAEVERLREALEIAQDYKDCGCSYDNPNDICLGHLKLFERLNARAALEGKQ